MIFALILVAAMRTIHQPMEAASVQPADCATMTWYMNADAAQCRAAFPPAQQPDCWHPETGAQRCFGGDGVTMPFHLYPPYALYDTWIPGEFASYLKPYGYAQQQLFDPSLPSLSELYHALGYQPGDAVWQTPPTTQQVWHVQFRRDGLAPTDLPPTGRPHGSDFKATLMGQVP